MSTREIKFRAWDIENKIMYHIITDVHWLVSGEVIGCRWCTSEIDDGKLVNDEGCVGGKHRFDLMQYTGLKDKNGKGKEIYEGDIIEFKSGIKPQRTIIEFEIHCYNAGFYPIGGANANHYWEVIGNKWEHPKLMEE